MSCLINVLPHRPPIRVAGILLYLVIHAEAQGPSCGAADTQLARYFYELLNNRADGCLPGANFITTPAADDVKLTYPEWCTEVS